MSRVQDPSVTLSFRVFTDRSILRPVVRGTIWGRNRRKRPLPGPPRRLEVLVGRREPLVTEQVRDPGERRPLVGQLRPAAMAEIVGREAPGAVVSQPSWLLSPSQSGPLRLRRGRLSNFQGCYEQVRTDGGVTRSGQAITFGERYELREGGTPCCVTDVRRPREGTSACRSRCRK